MNNLLHDNKDLDLQLQTHLAEYNSLRAEIIDRMKSQRVFILLALTGIGAVVSFSIQQKQLAILLSIPLLLPFLLVIWTENHFGIHQIAKYIRGHLSFEIRRTVKSETVLRWEDANKKLFDKAPRLLKFSMWTWLYCLFGLIPIITLIGTVLLAPRMQTKLISPMPYCFYAVWFCALATTVWGWILLIGIWRSRRDNEADDTDLRS